MMFEKQREQDHEEDDGLDQHLFHGPDRLADQLAAVAENLDRGAFRQLWLELG